MKLIVLVILIVNGMTVAARPMDDKKLEKALVLLIEEELLLGKLQEELEMVTSNEERKIKRQLQGEESMLNNFFNDYSRFSFNQASGSQFRPGR